MSKLLVNALLKKNDSRPPIWLMRQAGRYHSHYQALRKKHSFEDLCKIPELACETTMGPLREFKFDAAIMFSDLLFPLEALGLGLKYDPGPKLSPLLESLQDIDKLNGQVDRASMLQFQGDALSLIRKTMDQEGFTDEALLGFIGGPLTLFVYALCGSHQGDLAKANDAIKKGWFKAFAEKLKPIWIENFKNQISSEADTVAVMDTAAGEFNLEIYSQHVLPVLADYFSTLRVSYPEFPILYYSKGTDFGHFDRLAEFPIQGLGIDWRVNLKDALLKYGDRFAIQGNTDPEWLHLSPSEFETKVVRAWEELKTLPKDLLRGWICGLGHGVLPMTPEINVKRIVELNHELF